MKTKKMIIALAVLMLLTGCKKEEPQPQPEPDYVEDTLAKMNLKDKVGQMLMLYYSDDTVDDFLKERIKDVQPGGFILFASNITTYEKTLQFVKDLKELTDIPMLISIDMEGGNVQRMQSLEDITPVEIPFMNSVGKKNDVQLAEEVGKVIGQQLQVFGINMDMAPDADVFSNPKNTVIGKRSFGTDPQLVAEMANAVAKGLNSCNVISTYKHFPGHGDTETDSHYGLPVITKTKEELYQTELVPFKYAIEHGAEVIMTAHIAIPALTNGEIVPATLSKEIITDLLRGELGYKGVVITDALNMGAIAENYSDEQVYVKAINAGVDILLMPNGSLDAINIICDAVNKGKISEERINEAVRRILALKEKYVIDHYDEYLDKDYLTGKEAEDLMNQFK